MTRMHVPEVDKFQRTKGSFMADNISQNKIYGATQRRSTKRAATSLASPSTKQKVTLSPEQIAKRAYEIWQTKGCPHGQDREHWLQAERELSQRSSA